MLVRRLMLSVAALLPMTLCASVSVQMIFAPSSVARPQAVTRPDIAPIPDGSSYHSLFPARLLDTRSPGLSGPLGRNASIELQVTGRAGVPSTGATAVVFNLTGVGPTSPTYITVWPTGSSRPTVSNLNLSAGQVKAALVEVKLGRGGRVSLFNNAGAVHLIVDVAGWIGPATPSDSGGEYRTLQPERLLDTRTGTGAPAGVSGPARTIELQVTGRGRVPATGVSAVVLNVTVTAPTAAAYVTAWPAGSPRPLASNLNVVASATVPNRVVLKVGANGKISIFHNAGSMHVVADVSGYYTSTSGEDVAGAGFTGMTPTRLVDTRIGTGAPRAKLGAGRVLTVQVAGLAGVPGPEAQQPPTSVVVNLTATRSSAASFLTVWPGTEDRPLSSDVNFAANHSVPNLVIAKLSPGGSISIFNNAGSVDIIVDVLGWNSGDIALMPSAVILNGAEAAAVTAVTSTSVTFGSKPGAVAALTPGNVISSPITSHAPQGFLRKVTGVAQSGSGLTVQTTDAAITDVIAFGWLDAHAQAKLPPTIPGPKTKRTTPKTPKESPQSDAIHRSVGESIAVPLDHTFIDEAGLLVQSSGQFTASASVDLSLDVGWTGLHQASLTTTANETLAVALDGTYHGEWGADVPLGEVSFEPITFTIGPLLVEVQPTLNATLQATGTLDGHMHASLSQSASVSAGVDYEDGDLHPIQDRESQRPTFDGPTVTGSADGKAGVNVQLDAAFYGGQANLAASLIPYLRIHADQCYAQLFAGVDGNIHADISILGHDAAYNGDLTLAETRLISLDLGGPCWSGTVEFVGTANGTDTAGYAYQNDSDVTWTLSGPGNGPTSYTVAITGGGRIDYTLTDANGCTNTISGASIAATNSTTTQVAWNETDRQWNIAVTPLPSIPMSITDTSSGPQPQCVNATGTSTSAAYSTSYAVGYIAAKPNNTISVLAAADATTLNADVVIGDSPANGAQPGTANLIAKVRLHRPSP